MKIKNKDIVLTNKNGEHQRISFEKDSSSVHIWYDHIEDEIVIEGDLRANDINSNSSTVTLTHDQLSNLNEAPYLHLNQDQFDKLQVLSDGSKITNLHWHERVNGHKFTVNAGSLPNDSNPYDVHIIMDD